MLRIVARLSATAVGRRAEVVRHQNDIGGLDGDIRAAADRNADIGLGQRRGIVNAITGEGDRPMPGAERLQRGELAFRQDFGDDRRRSRPLWRRLRPCGDCRPSP